MEESEGEVFSLLKVILIYRIIYFFYLRKTIAGACEKIIDEKHRSRYRLRKHNFPSSETIVKIREEKDANMPTKNWYWSLAIELQRRDRITEQETPLRNTQNNVI